MTCETATVGFELGPDELKYWSDATGGWVQDETEIDVYVGGDSIATLMVVIEVAKI